VNQLRQLMLEEVATPHFAASTIRHIPARVLSHFSRYLRRPADQLGPEDHSASIRRMLVHQVEVQSEHRHPAAGVSAVFLHSRVEGATGSIAETTLSEEAAVTFQGYSVRKKSHD